MSLSGIMFWIIIFGLLTVANELVNSLGKKHPKAKSKRGPKLSPGEATERRVAVIARKELDFDGSHVWRDVLVPRVDGGVSGSEVDVIAAARAGVFVFECKEYAGWVFGEADQQRWTVSYPGGHKERLYNPCWQNHAHIKSLSSALGVPMEAMHGYVVFSDKDALKKVPEEAKGSKVVSVDTLARHLRRDVAGAQEAWKSCVAEKDVSAGRKAKDGKGEAKKPEHFLLDDDEVKAISQKIDGWSRASDTEARKAHILEVGRIEAGEACPVCGGKLAEREGKHGRFLGCSNFPRCHYTLPL